MPAVRTPEASRPTRRIAVPRCSLPRRGIRSATSITFDFAALPCGSGLSLRSLAFRPATFLSTLRSGCYQTPRKTRYTAAWLRLCRGRHFRRLNSTRLQGATLPKLDVSLSVSSSFPVPRPLTLATIRVDGHHCFGCRHYGYLPASTIEAPAALRHVDGFPVLGLLRPLRRHGPRGPKAIPCPCKSNVIARRRSPVRPLERSR